MIRFTQQELDAILAEFLGKPWRRFATGPDAYDCYGLAKAFMGRLGVDLAEIGRVDPKDSRPVYERQQTDYLQLDWPRPWSLAAFSSPDLDAHIGLVLPGDNLFLHCPGRAAGQVIAEPLNRRPWRDAVDGYWWPKGYLEAIVMLTPMTTTQRAWQFIAIEGRSLGRIIAEDITPGRDVPVQAFLDGELVEPTRWDLVPTERQQLVIRPMMGEGNQVAMMGGMIALSLLAPALMGALAPNLTAAATGSMAAGLTNGATFAYSLGKAAIVMAGGLALNALVGSHEAEASASQHYSWTPATTQQVGAFVPLVYGTFGTHGVLTCSYATSENTAGTNLFTKAEQITDATDLIHLKIAYSDGPIEGVVEGTETLNGTAVESYGESADFTIEHFRGTDDQAASSVPDAFEIPVGKLCHGPAENDHEVIKSFTAVHADRVAVMLHWRSSFCNYSADGDYTASGVSVRIRVREKGSEPWHTLSDEVIKGRTEDPVRVFRWFDETYDGGTPYTIVAGTQYEVEVARQSSRHSDHGDDFYFESVFFAFNEVQRLPGLAYTAIGAAASKDLSGSIDYYTVIKAKLVRVYDPATETWSIEWSDNPAWVTFDLLTRPVIRGNGDDAPYEVEYYKRLDPKYLILDEFVAFAQWCDTLVPDGDGGSEKRYTFNGVFDQDGSAWEQAIRVCQMACAMPTFQGHRIGIVIDKPGTPTQMFNISNLREGFSETWIDNGEAATVYDVEFQNQDSDYTRELWPVPLLGATRDVPASMDGFGHVKRSQVWRRTTRQLRVNRYMRRLVEIPACLDAIYTALGDIVYVQHPSLKRATGGRIVAVYADGIRLDKTVEAGEGDYALLIRTHDGTAERLTLYNVASVSGDDSDVVTIEGTWEYTPDVNDIWTFGEAVKVIDLYRIKGFERTGTGRVLLQAAQYTTDYYADDEEAPAIEARTYSSNLGGLSPSLLPTTAQAIAADRQSSSTSVDSLSWHGLSFTGDGVDTVTWQCLGDGIKYRGMWCPIVDDAAGTTDKYIYFDPAIGDPRYLQSTSDLADLAGRERYVFCINEGGVAYFQPGLLISPSDVKLATIEPGATLGATWGVDIADQPSGYLIQWQGTLASPPSDPEDGWAYRNSTDGKSYIYHDEAWYQMVADGADGLDGANGADGLSIVWKGDLASPPASPQANWAYRDTDDGYVYIYNGTAWELMVRDGDDGTAGADGADGVDGADGLSVFITYNDNAYDNPPSAPTGDGTSDGWHTSATSSVVWISQKVAASVSSGTWGTPVRIAGVDGTDGINGADGVDGASIVWKGTFSSHPSSPQDGWAYYNSTDKKSYIYQSGSWYQMTVDGVDGANGADGADGLSIVWKGDLASPPASPQKNWAYRDTDNGYAYIYNGTAWELMVRDGDDGTAGADGTDGLSVFVTYHDNEADDPPATPTGDGTSDDWHTDATGDVVWISQKVAASASSGAWGTPVRISGTAIWSEVIDDGGKPEDNADVTAATPVDSFLETFDVDSPDVNTRWIGYSGDPDIEIVCSDGVTGGRFARIGDNAGDDEKICRYYKIMPFDPSKLYRLRVRLRQTAGASDGVYVGVSGLAADGTTYVCAIQGTNVNLGRHWFIAAKNPSAWTEYTAYFKGHSALGDSDADFFDPANPGTLHEDVRYIAPAFIANYNDLPGTVDIDMMSIDVVPESADEIPDGGKYLKVFHDYFAGSEQEIRDRWEVRSGSSLVNVYTGGESGAKYIRLGDNSGDDEVWLVYKRSIPFDLNMLYRVRCRIRRTYGSGTCYVGVCGRNGDDDVNVNMNGTDNLANQFACAANGHDADSSWEIVTGYFKGTASTGEWTAHNDPSDPAVLHEDVRWFRPYLVLNYQGQAGTYEIDEFSVEIVSLLTPSSAYTGSALSVSTTETLIQSVAIVTSGESVPLWLGAVGHYVSSSSWLTYTLYRYDGSTETLVYTSPDFRINSYQRDVTFSMASKDSPPPGSYVYRLKAVVDTGTVEVSSRNIMTLEVN